MGKDVFISYASRDQESSERICSMLEARGIQCWIAPRDIVPGGVYAESIMEGIDTVFGMVLILSQNANESSHVRNEIERAVSKGKTIIPVRIENVVPSKSLELFVMSSHWVEAWQRDAEAQIERLAAALHTVKQRRGAAIGGRAVPQPAPAGPTPSFSSVSNAEAMFKSMAEGAWSDGTITESEKQFLVAKARELGISGQRARDLFNAARPAGMPAAQAAPAPAPAPPATPASYQELSKIVAQLQTAGNATQIRRKDLMPNSGSVIAGFMVLCIGIACVGGGVWVGMRLSPWGWILGCVVIMVGLLMSSNALPMALGLRNAVNCPKCGTSGMVMNRRGECKCKKCGSFQLD